MYSRTLLILCALFLGTVCLAKDTEHIKLLKEKKKACEAIGAVLSGKPGSLDKLISTAEEGLRLTTAKEHAFRFFFNQAIGTGYYYKQNFAKTRKYFEAAYTEATQANLLESSLKPLGNLVAVYHYMGLQSKADEAAQKLKLLAESTDTLKNKGDVYYNLGLYNQQQKFYYSIALSNFLKSAALHKPIADTTRVIKRKLDYGVILMMVAEIYLYLKQPSKALEYLNEARPYLNLSIIYDISAYGKLVRTYSLLNDKKEALKYYGLLHRAAGTKPSRWSELVSSNIEMAALELKEGNHKAAKLYVDKAAKQLQLDNSELLASSVNIAYGDYYKKLDNYAEAVKYYKTAERSARIYNKEQYADLLRSLTAVLIKSGKGSDAAAYFSKYVMVSDSLSQGKISLNLAEMEARFQNDFKQKKIAELNRENELKEKELKQEATTRWLLTGGALLLLGALALIYLNFRNKQKANLLLDKKNKELDLLNEQLTNANEVKTKLFGIIAHDLRSPVSQLFTFLKLQQEQAGLMPEEEKKKHQQRLMQSSSHLLETMEDLLIWSKSQMDNFELNADEVNIQELFSETALLMQGQAEVKGLEICIGASGPGYIRTDQNLLTIVLRNLLQNAVNHAFAGGVIYLNAGLNDQRQPFLSILNHGEVIPSDKIEELLNNNHVKSKSSGYGLLIVKELLFKINAVLKITSNTEDTTMQVIFL